jgi:hypothetical protein
MQQYSSLACNDWKALMEPAAPSAARISVAKRIMFLMTSLIRKDTA